MSDIVDNSEDNGVQPSDTQTQETISVETTIESFRKVGEGMNSYILYLITSKLQLPELSGDVSVERRFSDFIGLYERLHDKYSNYGFFVVLPPVKDMTQKVDNHAFLVKRKASLQQFIKMLCCHHFLHKDSLVVEFLSKKDPLPKTPKAISGTGLLKFVGRMASAVELKRFKEPEPDQWFTDNLSRVTSIENDLKGLYGHVCQLSTYRKELSQSLESAGSAISLLSNVEDSNVLSHAFSSLADTEHSVSRVYEDQFVGDTYLAESYNTYVSLIEAIKKAFTQRTHLFRVLTTANSNLAKKTDLLGKAETLNRLDKLERAKDELEEARTGKNIAQRDFDSISNNIKKEMGIFDKYNDDYFRRAMVEYLQTLLSNQTKITSIWEGFQDVIEDL